MAPAKPDIAVLHFRQGWCSALEKYHLEIKYLFIYYAVRNIAHIINLLFQLSS